jgi:hypothetical protein
MDFPELTRDEALLGLGAMKQVALVHGLQDHERSLMGACAAALGLEVALDEVKATTPEELAAGIASPLARERALQALLVMGLMDGSASEEELALIRDYARALDVEEPRVRSFELLAAGRIKHMWIDLARRSFARRDFESAFREEGARGVWRIVGPLIGLAKDPDLARRYNDLGQLPSGTFGRAYWDFVVSNGFGFPGEAGAVPERGVWHDLTHVLSGYGTDPDGEVQVVSFIAGYRKEDPFFWLFTIALQFQLGIKVSPYSPAGVTGRFDPEKVIAALRRGAAMNADLSQGWDYWPLFPLPLEEVRRRYNV